MSAMTPQEIAEKQIRRSQAASGDYTAGVQRTNKNPMQLAKAKKQKLKNNFIKSVDDGKWEAGLDSVTEADWKRLTVEKGGARYGEGIAKAADKIAAFHAEFQPFLKAVTDRINQMPDSTLDENIAKAAAQQRAVAQFRRRGSRRS